MRRVHGGITKSDWTSAQRRGTLLLISAAEDVLTELPSLRHLLEHTPAAITALIAAVPPDLLSRPEAPGRWSADDVVRHLADLERDAWLPRISAVLQDGPPVMLAPIERERFRSRDHNLPLTAILTAFAERRRLNLSLLDGLRLGDDDLRRSALHPSLGAVRLAELVTAWALHDLSHLSQISRAVAAQYRAAVGPWSDFLAILRPTASPPPDR